MSRVITGNDSAGASAPLGSVSVRGKLQTSVGLSTVSCIRRQRLSLERSYPLNVDGPWADERDLLCPGGTRATIRPAELSDDPRAVVVALGHTPGYRHLTLRAGDPLAFSVDRAVGQIVPVPGAELPARHGPHRPLERDAV